MATHSSWPQLHVTCNPYDLISLGMFWPKMLFLRWWSILTFTRSVRPTGAEGGSAKIPQKTQRTLLDWSFEILTTYSIMTLSSIGQPAGWARWSMAASQERHAENPFPIISIFTIDVLVADLVIQALTSVCLADLLAGPPGPVKTPPWFTLTTGPATL